MAGLSRKEPLPGIPSFRRKNAAFHCLLRSCALRAAQAALSAFGRLWLTAGRALLECPGAALKGGTFRFISDLSGFMSGRCRPER